jgi:aminotransferase
MDSATFCARMIREGLLAAVPGSCFGTEGFIRISYCYGDETLRAGMDRLERFIGTL